MSTSGAAVWGPTGPIHAGPIHAGSIRAGSTHAGPLDAGSVDADSLEAAGDIRLTRRGRLIRSGALLTLMLLLALKVASGFSDGRAPAADPPRHQLALETTSVVVERGDSLWRFAQRAAPGSDPREVVVRIRELNGLRSNLIQPGQVLLLPSSVPQ